MDENKEKGKENTTEDFLEETKDYLQIVMILLYLMASIATYLGYTPPNQQNVIDIDELEKIQQLLE